MKAKIRMILMSEVIDEKNIPADSVCITFPNGIELYCFDFAAKENDIVPMWLHRKGKWSFVCLNQYYKEMRDFHRQHHYVGNANRHLNYTNMMKHDRKQKSGGSGQRLTPFCGQVTDYETRKEPFHDFRRVWN